MAGVHGSIIVPANYTNNTAFCGIHVDSKVTAAGLTNAGRFSAFECKKSEGRDWDYGVYIADATQDVRLHTGAKIFSGAQATEANVTTEVAAYDAVGSIYLSTAGHIFVQVADTGAATDWKEITHA
jgi:hypothetical protein